jgi:hypothetical protein
MNLRKCLEMAGGSLLAVLDAEKEWMPTGGYEVAHDLGRWWDAVLRLEETIGFVIPTELEAASLKNLKRLTDNPDRLLMNNPDIPWLREKVRINSHNFRESLLAFGGLVRVRDNFWAHEAAIVLVRAMDQMLQEDGSFDYTQLVSWGQVQFTQDPSHIDGKRDGWFDGTATSGRSLEALVWLYETTGEPLVLDVARRIAEHHLAYSTNPDGSIRNEIVSPDNIGHNHSYHGTLRGLLLYGLLTGEKEYVHVVEATYRQAIRNQIVKESGWAPHDLGMDRFSNEYGDPVSDPASTGDAAQLALWLALHADCHDLLDDVERYVRARLIPAQFTDEDLSRHPEHKLVPRDMGAWGIHDHSHGGKHCTPDVLAAVTHSLCDIYRNICTSTELGLRINLHFDYEDEQVKILSTRSEQGRLSILVKEPCELIIRIPGWISESTLYLTIDGEVIPLKRKGLFATVSTGQLSAKSEIVMSYDLPIRYTEEQMPSGRCYRFKWRGDEIIGFSPQDTPMPFYPILKEN